MNDYFEKKKYEWLLWPFGNVKIFLGGDDHTFTDCMRMV